jgi:glutamate 5-kinase
LPAGVRRVEGHFARGDCVILRDETGAEIGRGLVAFDVDEVMQITGRKSGEIEGVLGVAGRAEVIHRDDMALVGEAEV